MTARISTGTIRGAPAGAAKDGCSGAPSPAMSCDRAMRSRIDSLILRRDVRGLCQAPELRNVIGGGNSDLEQKRSGGATLVIGWSHGERGAVRHGGDRVGLDQILTLRIAPDLTRITVHGLREGVGAAGSPCTSVHCLMISPALVGITVVSMPPCQTDITRPRPLVWRRTPHQVAPHAGGTRGTLEHAFESFLDIRGRAIRQARDDGSTGEDIGIGREHDRGHGSAGR